MKLRSVLSSACAGAVAFFAFGSFAVAGPPAPGPVCRVAAIDLTPVHATEPGTGLYANGMFAYDAPPPVVSGTMSFFGEGKRYDVPFKDVQTNAVGFPPKTYLAVRFPKPVHLDVAYVSALATPVSTACPPETLARTDESAPSHAIDVVATVDAPPPVDDGGSCQTPFAAAKTIKALPPDTPDEVKTTATVGRDETWLLVHLSPKGAVAGTTIIKPSKFSSFDYAVVRAARWSTYAPTIFRCVAVDSYYMFIGVYEVYR